LGEAMSDNAKLKIALFAYCETFLDKYHAHLHTKADCWWVVWNPHLRRDLLKFGYKKIFFEDTYLLAFRHQIKNIIIRELHGLLFYTFKLGLLRQGHLVKKVNATFQPDIWLSDSTTKLVRTKVRGMTVVLFHSVCYKKYQMQEETLLYDLILLSTPPSFYSA
jgi:hypothetical protein